MVDDGHVVGRIGGVRHAQSLGVALRQDIRTAHEEAQRFMRILYEDLKQDLGTLRDGR